MKRCVKCGREKPIEDFYKNKASKDGRYSYCRSCSRAASLDWKWKNIERHTENTRKWKARPENKLRMARNRREWYYRNKLGMERGDYDRMLATQNGVCAICKSPPTETMWLAVDHCHDTNVVRGILCSNCNTALGLMKDDVSRLRAAIRYLQKKR